VEKWRGAVRDRGSRRRMTAMAEEEAGVETSVEETGVDDDERDWHRAAMTRRPMQT
jgi:hypothetical protein